MVETDTMRIKRQSNAKSFQQSRVEQKYKQVSYISQSSFAAQPPRSLPPELANFVLDLAFLPPSSLYIPRISNFPGLVASASARHCSSLISLGVWYPDIPLDGVVYPELSWEYAVGGDERSLIDFRYT